MKKFKATFSVLLVVAMIFTTCFIANAETVIIETESNNDYASANEVSINSTFGGVLSSALDVDYYKIVPDANGKLELIFKHEHADYVNNWKIRILYSYKDDSGHYESLSTSYVELNDDESIKFPTVGVVKSEDYYIIVEQGEHPAINREYTIEAKFTPTDFYENEGFDATQMGLNSNCSGVINNDNDVDIYTIIPDTDGKLEVRFKHKFKNSGKYDKWEISIYGYDKDIGSANLTSTEIVLDGAENIKLPSVGVKKGREYTILVSQKYNSNVIDQEYTIETTFTPTEHYEKELNNSYAIADRVEKDVLYSANINLESKDFDYFVYNSKLNERISVTFNHTFESTSNMWNVNFQKYENGIYKDIYSATINENDSLETEEIYTLEVATDATYYIIITGTSTKEYSFNLGNVLVTQPAESTTQPTTEPTHPTIKPTEPTTQLTESTTEQTTEPSTIKPTEPITNPTEPATQLTEPITKPTEPTPQPTTKPTEPTTEPAQPTTKPNEPTTQPTTKPVTTPLAAVVKVKTPSQSTVSYGDSIILHAEVKNLPDGAEIVWSANNANFKIVSTSDDGMSCTVTPVSSGDTVFTATVVDKDGKEIANDEQIMNSKAGIWQKIIAFFKNLFGLTKVIPEFIKF